MNARNQNSTPQAGDTIRLNLRAIKEKRYGTDAVMRRLGMELKAGGQAGTLKVISARPDGLTLEVGNTLYAESLGGVFVAVDDVM